MKYGLGSMLIALSSVRTSPPALAQTDGDAISFWHHGWELDWNHMVFGWFWMIVILGGGTLLVALSAWWLSHRSSNTGPSSFQQTPTLELLQERYARGEIDNEEFEQYRRLLSG